MPAVPIWASRVREVVDATQALESDLMVVLGDYFATHRSEGPARRLFDPRQSRLVVRDRPDAPGAGAIGMPLLENDAILIGPEGSRFWLAGLGDQLAHWLGPNRFRGEDDLPGTLARVSTDDPVILLAHEPDIRAGARRAHARRPHPWWPDPPAACAAGLGAVGIRRPLRLHIVEQGRHMIVSGGLGCSKVPLRLGVPPEILRIELS